MIETIYCAGRGGDGGSYERWTHKYIMVGPTCPIMHQFSHKARADIKNDRLKAIKAALSLSKHLVHNVMFEFF